MAKVYIANTALILEDEAGKQFRVEAGEAVELTPEQYESVAAHVTPTVTTIVCCLLPTLRRLAWPLAYLPHSNRLYMRRSI